MKVKREWWGGAVDPCKDCGSKTCHKALHPERVEACCGENVYLTGETWR